MRYSNDERAILVGQFEPNDTVTIKLLDLGENTEIPTTDNICIESDVMPGIFLWDTSKVGVNQLDNFHNVLYEMKSNDGSKYYGKFVYGGYMDKELTVLLDNPESYDAILKLLRIINGRI